MVHMIKIRKHVHAYTIRDCTHFISTENISRIAIFDKNFSLKLDDIRWPLCIIPGQTNLVKPHINQAKKDVLINWKTSILKAS